MELSKGQKRIQEGGCKVHEEAYFEEVSWYILAIKDVSCPP